MGLFVTKGFSIGFKATVVINFSSMNFVCILIYFGFHDAKFFDKKLKITKNMNNRKKDIIIFDKGYFSYKNYQTGINKCKIVPFIFQKTISTKQSSTIKYPTYYSYLSKQRKYWHKNNSTTP